VGVWAIEKVDKRREVVVKGGMEGEGEGKGKGECTREIMLSLEARCVLHDLQPKMCSLFR